jgi:hypothetical protein
MRLAAAFLVALTIMLQVIWAVPAGDAQNDRSAPAAGRGILSIAFTGPAETTLNRTTVDFTGTTSDTDAVVKVELSPDGVIWTPATDNGGPSAFSNWSCTLQLPEGTNTVTARGNDTAGSGNTASVVITIDLLPPALSVTSPHEGVLTNKTMFPVSGQTEPGAKLTIGADAATVLPDGSFNATTRLVAGNNIVEVRATDAAGNEAFTTLKVFLDAVAPFLNAWATVTLTNRSSVPVFGETEPGANVTIAGSEVLVGVFGNFSAGVALVQGMNQVLVSSHDRAGNYNFALVEVVLDDRPPQVTITKPENATVVNDPEIEVCGTASDQSGITGVQVGVDGHNYTLAGGNTTWRGSVRLPEGEHNISVLVFDRAGNSNLTNMKITYVSPTPDLAPPSLVISSPEPGSRAPKTIQVGGQVSDPSGVAYVQVSLNNRTWRNCTLNAARTGWSASIAVRDGWTTIYVRAFDTKGNNGTATVRVEHVPPAAPPPPDYVPYLVGAIVVILIAFASFTAVNFWRKWTDHPEPGLGEDEAVVELPAKGLK